MSPVAFGLAAIDAAVVAQTVYAVHDYRKHSRKKRDK
jgi:hypothetical protein